MIRFLNAAGLLCPIVCLIAIYVVRESWQILLSNENIRKTSSLAGEINGKIYSLFSRLGSSRPGNELRPNSQHNFGENGSPA